MRSSKRDLRSGELSSTVLASCIPRSAGGRLALSSVRAMTNAVLCKYRDLSISFDSRLRRRDASGRFEAGSSTVREHETGSSGGEALR